MFIVQVTLLDRLHYLDRKMMGFHQGSLQQFASEHDLVISTIFYRLYSDSAYFAFFYLEDKAGLVFNNTCDIT
jgi:hypothetical protein